MVASTSNELDIWTRLTDGSMVSIRPESAHALLELRFSQSDLERVNELSERARRGSLTSDEEQELDRYIHVGAVLSVLHSRARVVLRDETASR